MKSNPKCVPTFRIIAATLTIAVVATVGTPSESAAQPDFTWRVQAVLADYFKRYYRTNPDCYYEKVAVIKRRECTSEANSNYNPRIQQASDDIDAMNTKIQQTKDQIASLNKQHGELGGQVIELTNERNKQIPPACDDYTACLGRQKLFDGGPCTPPSGYPGICEPPPSDIGNQIEALEEQIESIDDQIIALQGTTLPDQQAKLQQLKNQKSQLEQDKQAALSDDGLSSCVAQKNSIDQADKMDLGQMIDDCIEECCWLDTDLCCSKMICDDTEPDYHTCMATCGAVQAPTSCNPAGNCPNMEQCSDSPDFGLYESN